MAPYTSLPPSPTHPHVLQTISELFHVLYSIVQCILIELSKLVGVGVVNLGPVSTTSLAAGYSRKGYNIIHDL